MKKLTYMAFAFYWHWHLAKNTTTQALLTNELSKVKPKSLSSSDHLGPFCPIS